MSLRRSLLHNPFVGVILFGELHRWAQNSVLLLFPFSRGTSNDEKTFVQSNNLPDYGMVVDKDLKYSSDSEGLPSP